MGTDGTDFGGLTERAIVSAIVERVDETDGTGTGGGRPRLRAAERLESGPPWGSVVSELPSVYGGEILHVDLESGESEREEIDPEQARALLGGNGFAAAQVREHVPTDAGPFDPENVVVFAVGPMNATPFQSTSRGVVGFVSPMTNGFFDSTFGDVPRAQKTTGFEAIVLHGEAPELSTVVVDEHGATVAAADGLAGSIPTRRARQSASAKRATTKTTFT